MNEGKIKNIFVIIILTAFALLITLQSVCYNYSARRADTEIDSLKRELASAGRTVELTARELEDSRTTIRECHDAVGRIADNLAEQSTELQSIISNLKTVREEVKNMEDALSFFYIKYGYNNSDTNSDSEVEQ